MNYQGIFRRFREFQQAFKRVLGGMGVVSENFKEIQGF